MTQGTSGPAGLGRRSNRSVFAVVAVTVVLAVACGGGDDDDGDGGDTGGARARTDATDPDEGRTPEYGGRIVFAREAETALPWTPAAMQCDLACHQAARTVFDSLTYTGQDQETHPFLLRSIEPNDDYTAWTLTARDGISFHDGTPFDAATLLDHFERMRASPLIGPTLSDVDDVVEVDDMTVEVRMSRPWVTFPGYLSTQPGLVASPTWLAAVEAGQADPTEPVGTGPFVFAEYNSGRNFRVTRNDGYWLSDADGNPYPYLDEIEFVVQEDDLTRDRSITSGEVDITHTDRGESLPGFREAVAAGDLEMYEITERSEVTYGLVNGAAPDSPVSDVRIRRAIAHAIDQDLRNEARVGGMYPVADGPFPPGVVGHLEDNGWPEYDPDRARELVEEYRADTGRDTVEIALNTTADSENRATVELLQQFLEEVGIEVTIAQLEQAEFLSAALVGDFEVFTFRNHGGAAEGGRVWWHSETAAPIGALALNTGRITDDVIDESLDTLRESDDPAVQQEAAEAINRRFAEQVYNVWFDWVYWSIPHQPRVNGVRTPIRLPDGAPSSIRTVGAVGGIGVAQLWVDDAAG